MARVIVHNTPMAHWHALVNDAQAKSHIYLNEELESYLVFLLMRFMQNIGLTDHSIAIDFLEHISLDGLEHCDHLQHVGDKCLLFSGFFSDRNRLNRGRTRYLIDVGQSAYDTLSTHYETQNRDLFSQLAHEFTSLCDVLMRLSQTKQAMLSNNATVELSKLSNQWFH